MTTQLQRAVFLPEKQGNFTIQSRAIPTPTADQLLIKITSIALNPLEWKIQSWGFFVETYPTLLGSDAAGVVEAVGSAVSAFKKGDRVFFQGNISVQDEATYQEYAVVPADIVVKTPENISDDSAASISSGAITAVIALFHAGGHSFPSDGPTAKGQPVVILGGSSSVGQYAIQLARLAGFSPIITTATPANKKLLTSLGATHLIDRNSGSIVEDIQSIAPSITLVFDTISAKETHELGLKIIKEDTVGSKLIVTMPADESITAKNDGRKHPIDIKMIYASSRTFKEVLLPFFARVGGWIESGEFVPNNIEVVGGLEDVQKGLDKSKAGVSAIKLIVNP